MAKKLGFKDFITVDYAPGMPDLIKKNAKKRKGDTGAGSNAEYASTHPPRTDEVTDPLAGGQHAKNVGMGWTGKHRIIKDPGSKTGRHTHVFQYTDQVKKEEADVDEALTMTQRRQRARIMKRLAPRIKLGRERAKRRIASPEKLQRRAQKQARMAVFKRLTKDVPKSELTYARRQEIEKRLDKPAVKKRIERIAKKMLPKVRKAELEKKRGSSSND